MWSLWNILIRVILISIEENMNLFPTLLGNNQKYQKIEIVVFAVSSHPK